MSNTVDFRLLFESAPAKYLVLDPSFVIVAVSDDYLAAVMRRRSDLVGRFIFDAFPDDPSDPHATGVANLRASLERVRDELVPDSMAVQRYPVENPAMPSGWEVRLWSPMNAPVVGPDGRLLYIIHRAEDVTDYVRLMEEAAEETLDDSSPARSVRARKVEAEVFQRAQQIQVVNQELRTLRNELEERVERRTEELVQAHEALRASEEQLRQSQKMEAIGRLAGGIAHDFNNLLTVIVSYADMLRGGHRQDQLDEDLSEIKNAALRAADLTRQLLVFSRKQVLQPAVLDLGDVLSGMAKMLGRVLGEDIELQLGLAPDLYRVYADRSQMEQVIVNIVVNARDAMPYGGKLILEAGNVDLGQDYAREHLGMAPGRYVVLAFSDTGHGMDRTTLDRIFEPFFTTKEEGRGTGLGLSTVFGIVKQSGGHIWVYSEVGLGTTFKIYLPESTAKQAPAPPPVAPRSSVGSETVLLVEDEPALRAVAVTILRKAGFEVIEAGSPVEALRIALHELDRIDLVLTDVVMPGMNGRELIDRLRVARPSLKAIMMSGYTDQVVVHHGELAAGVFFMQKPFTPDSLTLRVRQVLDGQS